MSDLPRIGFIGLGLMGSAMVSRLLDRGYPLTVIANRSRANVETAVARGATAVTTPKALAEASAIVMVCVDTSASVEGRMLGDEGVIAGLGAGATIIDFGTSLPGSTKMLGAAVAAKGAQMLDAPLGRTPAHAYDGKLNIMGAGDPDACEAVRPVLEDLGENVFHVGPLGAGHTLKLINNFFAMTTACAMSEAFAMADLAEIPRQTLFDVMGAGPLRSGMMEFIKAQAIDGEIELAFSVSNGHKDVGYYRQMADQLGAPSLMSASARTALGMAKAQGFADRMVPEMVHYFADLFAEDGK